MPAPLSRDLRDRIVRAVAGGSSIRQAALRFDVSPSMTYIPTGEDWLYLAAVLDLATRKVVGWAMRDHMRTELTLGALIMAAQRQRPGPGLIHHSDRGSQYAAEAYAQQLALMGAKPSMNRTGCCNDNAPMESFFHSLKVELIHQRR